MALQAAVIGCGNITRFHFPGLLKAGVQIRWICDINEQAARSWLEKTGARYTADYRQAIADPEVDLVDITVLSKLHKPMALTAIEAGKAVICEKTLTETSDDALEVVQAAKKKGTILYTSYMKRFIPAVQKAKELLPGLGTILSTHIRAYQQWGNLWDETPTEGFFHVPEGGQSLVRSNYGGGILLCGGSHILDLVLFFLGRPKRLYANMHTPGAADYDVRTSVLLETNNGVVHYEALAHPLNRIGFLQDGWDEQVEIIGTRGKLNVYSSAWDQHQSKPCKLVHYDNATGQSAEYRYFPDSPFERAMAFFCGNIVRGEQGSQSRNTGYEVNELIDTIKRSSQAKQALEITWRLDEN